MSGGAPGLVTTTTKARVNLEVVHTIEEMARAVPPLDVDHVVETVDIHPKVDRLVGATREVHSAGLILKKKKLSRILSSELWPQRLKVKIRSMKTHFGNVNVIIQNMPSYCIEMLVLFHTTYIKIDYRSIVDMPSIVV